jgi:hypothetical protein
MLFMIRTIFAETESFALQVRGNHLNLILVELLIAPVITLDLISIDLYTFHTNIEVAL